MKRVLTAVVLIPLVLLAVFRAPIWLLAVLVAGIIALTLHEYLAIAEAAGTKPFKGRTYVMSLIPIGLMLIQRRNIAEDYYGLTFGLAFFLQWLGVLLVSAVILGIPLIFRKDLGMGLASVGASLLGIIYVGGSLSLLVCLRADQSILVIVVLFSVWAGDIAAYYVGRSIGKHKLAPVVSPNKSWEGAIASVAASVAVTFLVFHFQSEIGHLFTHPSPMSNPWWFHVAVLGLLINVSAQFGDLFESALKRGAGVKDSGTMLPGHGGVLDRIDALLFAIPAAWYYANYVIPTSIF